MKYKDNIIVPLIAVMISFITLLLLKAELTGVALFEINFFFFGNIVSFINHLLVAVGIILIYLKKTGVENHHKKIIRLISLILLIPLTIILIILRFDISFPGIYIFEYPLEKIVISAMSNLYMFILLFLLFLVWSIFLIRGYRIYLDAAVLSTATLCAFYIFSFLYTLSYEESSHDNLYNEKNVAFVLGAAVWQHDKPSPLFEGRIKKSLELYNKGMIDKIQVTGSNAPGELSEAKTAYNYLLSKGVNKSDILVEENSSSTHEQIQFLKQSEMDYKKRFKNIVLISDEFHMVRIQELCSYYELDVTTITSDYKLNWQKLLYYRTRESVALFLFWLFGI